MCKRLTALLAILFLAQHSNAEQRTIACKTPAIAALCFTTHGRLRYGNGSPSLRLWQIGTHHEFGIYSNLAGLQCDLTGQCQDDDSPHLPANLETAFNVPNPYDPVIYADFEVCPLERHIERHMQAACIQSAKHIIVK